jgi:hypothetical protein
MNVKLNSQLDRRHGSKNINLILALITLIGRVHHIAIQVQLKVIPPPVIVVNQPQHIIPLTLCQVLVRSARLQTVY